MESEVAGGIDAVRGEGMAEMSKQTNRKRAGCTCNKIPLGLCFMHPPKLKKISKSKAHSGRGIR